MNYCCFAIPAGAVLESAMLEGAMLEGAMLSLLIAPAVVVVGFMVSALFADELIAVWFVGLLMALELIVLLMEFDVCASAAPEQSKNVQAAVIKMRDMGYISPVYDTGTLRPSSYPLPCGGVPMPSRHDFNVWTKVAYARRLPAGENSCPQQKQKAG